MRQQQGTCSKFGDEQVLREARFREHQRALHSGETSEVRTATLEVMTQIVHSEESSEARQEHFH